MRPQDSPLANIKIYDTMAKTSIHLEPAKNSADKHNRREKELDYIRHALSHRNEVWCSVPDLGAKFRAEIAALVKAKTGRKMQAKATPLREGVVVIQESTTMEQLREIGNRFKKRFGVNLVHIAIHRDEGRWVDSEGYSTGTPPDDGPKPGEVWKPNLHAHLIFDWYNHQTGKSIRTSRLDAIEMQDICAEVLGMERGVSSDKKHMQAAEYKAKARMQEMKEREEEERERIRKETRAAEGQLQALRKEAVVVEKELEKELQKKLEEKVRLAKEKVKQANREAEEEVAEAKRQAEEEKARLAKDGMRIMKAFVQGAGKMVGVGRMAEAEHRVQQLEQEVKAVKAAAEKQHKAYMRAAQSQLQKAKDEVEKVKQQLSEREEEVKDMRQRLTRIAYTLYDVYDVVRVAVLAIINFAKNQSQAILHHEEVKAVKAAAREIGGESRDEQQQAGGMLCDCAAAIGELTFSQQHKAEKEVQDAILGKYSILQHESEDQQEQRGRKR